MEKTANRLTPESMFYGLEKTAHRLLRTRLTVYVLRATPHHASNMTCKARDLHEGDWGKPGAVLCWKW
ncbi:hypothetical protein WN943_011684 [Citrus x changshan-huyou]